MRLLFCCEFYHPSIGGVQEVMRQLAEGMVKRGHEVTVATTRLSDRSFNDLNGVRIEEFNLVGNAQRGMKGEIERYQNFVIHANVDAVLIKAAQQWTFDALWPVLDRIQARKVFIPCGFSGFYQPSYADYFRRLPEVLRRFDHLIFYASQYRDIDYVKNHGMAHFSVLSNGASEAEFEVPRDELFRRRHNIPDESFVFLTVGSLTGTKGHLELAKAFTKLNTNGRRAVLILNGNTPKPPLIVREPENNGAGQAGWKRGTFPGRLAAVASHVREVFFIKRWAGVLELIVKILKLKLKLFPVRYIPTRFSDPLRYWIEKANKRSPLKRVLLTDMGRNELIQAYKNTDLFVFASNVEYSPLVLFESVAAGTPFLSVPVGNAAEIAEWTGGGMICPAVVDSHGFTRVSPGKLAEHMEKAMNSPALLKQLGATGHNRWKEKFTWSKIVVDYERILTGKPAI